VAEHFSFSGDDIRLSENYLVQVVELLKPRVQFEHEILAKGNYLFASPNEYDNAVIEKKWKEAFRGFFTALTEAFTSMTTFEAAVIDEQFKQVAQSQDIKPGEVMQLFRVMISGQGAGVDMFGMLALLGKTEVNNRIEKALSHISTAVLNK
jgi:glutamyl-tRNA synthetase